MPAAVAAKEVIQFIGLKELLPEEQDLVQSLTTKGYEKIKRDLRNTTSLLVHVKRYKKAAATEEKRQKYSVHVKVVAATRRPIVSCKAHDWELARALHKAFNDIRNQLKHAFYTDETRPKPYD
jgi:hypothetical protein